MRFFADGPNIPDELLEARDRGNVVFLCGAGVSIPAGMPTFLELAKKVVDDFGAPPNSTLRYLLSFWGREDIPDAARPPLDQIFNLLQQEYDESEVDCFIAKQLKAVDGICVSKHRTILRLSKGAGGNPQIVTTNFDHLFELATSDLITHAPPTLPSLESEGLLDGLVYLHGRIDPELNPGEARQGLIVSSSDFGRAYLAEGWATRFVRDLLDHYIVVLLGYRADDPPMRYLLQGLRSMGHRNGETIYAFASGSEEEVQASWRDRGVEAIAYPQVAGDHSSLWDSLEVWAQRADDPLGWQQRVLELAKRGPRNLEKHERGQVASLVRTVEGAKRFADADPPPLGEWLCVFDSAVRYEKAEQVSFGFLPDFDPLVEYGLDDDQTRQEAEQHETASPCDDLLSLRDTDSMRSEYLKLAGMSHQDARPLPDRLFHLARWIERIAHEPVTPWWAARYLCLHSELLKRIEYRIENHREDFQNLAIAIWNLLIEQSHTSPDSDSMLSWYEASRRIEVEGWTNSVLRAFARSVKPYVRTMPRSGTYSARPPDKDWQDIRISDIARFEVAFPQISDKKSKVTDEALPAVYRVVRPQLEVAAGILEDLGIRFWETPTFYPKDDAEEEPTEDPDAYFLWFRDLLDRMIEIHPELIRADADFWPKQEPYFFDKLRLYTWSFSALYSGDEVSDGLLNLSDRAFWNFTYRPELLHLLRRRWQELTLEHRTLLEKRLVEGRPKFESESEENYRQRNSVESAKILGWLRNRGCELSDETLAVLPSLRSVVQHWPPEWDETADLTIGGIGGFLEIDSDPSSILNEPPSKIIPLAREFTTTSISELTDRKPFDGLVKQRPDRAVAALMHEEAQGEYPLKFWDSLFRNWPEVASQLLIRQVGDILMRLPSEVMGDLWVPAFRWLKEHLPQVAKQDYTLALRIFDTLLGKLFDSGKDATKSTISKVMVAGDSQGWSRRTFSHARNGPVGVATELLFDFLESRSPEQGSGVPPDIKSRLERLIGAPGEGTAHAVCLVSHNIEWLYGLDPEWVRATIVPWFDPGHPDSEPAWNGFLFRGRLPSPELLSLIKAYFLQVFSRAHDWKWSDERLKVLHRLLVYGCLNYKQDNTHITLKEARRALQRTDHSGRAHSVYCLTETIRKGHAGWKDFGKPFLEGAWPKETALQTEETSLNFVDLARVAGDDFPDVVRIVLPYMVPISGNNWFIVHRLSRSRMEGVDLPSQFPEATLALLNQLVHLNPSEIPRELNLYLENIGEAEPSLRQDSRWRRLNDIVYKS